MIYTREYLKFTVKTLEETQEVVQRLVNAAVNNEQLTLSEAKFLGSVLSNAEAADEEGRIMVKRVYDSLPGYHFWALYVKYAFDLNGEGLIRGPFGPISQEQKTLDAAFLEEQFQSWHPVVSKTNHKHTALQYITKESRDDIKEALRFARQIGDGSRRTDMIYKTLVIHNKYVFSHIEEYYQEHLVRQDVIQLCGWEVVIDSFVYAHVAIRHMASWTKFGRPGKTFFDDEHIAIDRLPRVIIDFLQEYERRIGCGKFDGRKIYFKFNNRNYVIWFDGYTRPVKGGRIRKFLRVESFYPAEIKNDPANIAKLKFEQVSSNLGFYI